VAHIAKNTPLISLQLFQWGGTRHICVAHNEHALLIDGLSVAHIQYVPRITLTEVRPVGPRWGPQVINGALTCATKRTNFNGAFHICTTDKTGYFRHDPSGGSHIIIRGAFCSTCAINDGGFHVARTRGTTRRTQRFEHKGLYT
jgi:hypothetical protein